MVASRKASDLLSGAERETTISRARATAVKRAVDQVVILRESAIGSRQTSRLEGSGRTCEGGEDGAMHDEQGRRWAGESDARAVKEAGSR
jgi:hypothetical protein